MHDWPARVTKTAVAYFIAQRRERSVNQEWVTWGNRVILSHRMRKEVLNLFHDGHLLMTRMKILALSCV